MNQGKKWKKVCSMIVAVFVLLAAVTAGVPGRKAMEVQAAYATPRLMVTGYDVQGGTVYAGEEFDMVIHLKNESTTTMLYNVKLKLSTAENEIITVSGSDSIYIEKIGKGEEQDVTVKLKAGGNLEQKAYSMNVSYNYENNYKQSFEDTATLSIPVCQRPIASISEKRISKDTIEQGNKSNISFKINNQGKDKLYNVNVAFTGNMIDDISLYVGTIETGDSGMVDMSVTGSEIGDGNVTAAISYEDAEGNISTDQEEFALAVIQPVADYGAMEAKGGISPLVVIVLVVVVVVIIVVVRIRKKKEEAYE